ncbi:peptidase C60 sortase A and B [Roseiflexus castenholzii DSM 13941]|uniref:Peptidase C60 sortase A and B n=1 Tax=Roseiflexus castenholzii (strain DSM 13941 / HLO8) TaxID=383372 RepID=A7NHV4_ROSCS|nr:peptidase C60 sortase A and B [Roseiflexus castenholzii DSM 13941]
MDGSCGRSWFSKQHSMIARLLMIIIVCAGALLPSSAHAQRGERCFTETGYCIGGRIREFWEQNGGLRVFGYPITPLQTETIEGRTLQVQWFERARLELHPANRRPYDVQLGRLGAELLARSDRGGTPVNVAASGECRLFPQTGVSACGPILAAWRSVGLQLDGKPGVSEAESLALFGVPLTDARLETLADGKAYVVQWFERGRFEVHPENMPPANVLLGLLGREYGPVARAGRTAGDVPARIVAGDVGMDARIVAVGLDAQGMPIVPDHDVGWYNRSALPGQGENVVLWGHVLRFSHAPRIPAPFARLKELRPGARLTVYDSNGTAFDYVVTRQVWVRPTDVEWMLPQGRERLTLISCIGDKVIVGREVVDMSHRLITIAEPVR